MKKKHFLPLLMLIMGIFLAAVNVHAAEKIIKPDRAWRSGDYIYYAIGNDGAGQLHKYNVKTKKDAVISKALYTDISTCGSYVFATRDAYTGTDGSNDYIYKIRKDGKAVKKLDKGRNPVIVGDWLYYIKTKKYEWYDGFYSDKIQGIYRMKLDGSSRQAIYKGSDVWNLMASSSKLYFQQNGKQKMMSLTGKNVVNATFTGKEINALEWYVRESNGSVIYNGWKYSINGTNVYRTKNGVTKKVKTFPYQVKVLVEMNGWIFVVCDNGMTARVYTMKGDGSSAKCLTAFRLAGGGY